jgi:hypothetical protein
MDSDQAQLFPSVADSVRSAEVWYDDGNLVLQAENTLFRVHRSILTRKSAVFSEMLAVPQPDKSSEKAVDGCEVVQLGDDTAYDMEQVLRAIYGEQNYVGSSFITNDAFKLTFFAIDPPDTSSPRR